MEETVYLTDLSTCLPCEALSTTATNNQWQVVDYDAGTLKGRMIAAQALVDAPDVRLPLNAKGWHGISIGFWPGVYYDSLIKYRLSTEEVFSVIQNHFEFQWDKTDILETFPRYVDLTGVDSVILGKQKTGQPLCKACIAYVKLQPLSDSQREEVARDRQRTDTRKIISMNDGEGLFIHHSPRTRNELLEQVEIYRHSDVEKVLWGVNYGDLTYYHSKVGTFYGSAEGACPTQEHKTACESHAALAGEGVVPFEAVMEHVHSMGLEFHTYYRLAIGDHVHPHNIFSGESFLLKEHPEYHMVARDGTAMMKASYAFPGVRDFMVSLMEESMQVGVDGVHLCFSRGPEYFAYEKPVVDDFMKQYGEDPRNLDEEDERLLRLKAGYMTEFVRAVRRAADTHGDRRGRRIQVSAHAEWSQERLLHFGYDLETWLREGLLDFVIGAAPARLVALAREKGCKVYSPSLGAAWLVVSLESHIHGMWHAYARDLDGMALWDLNTTQFHPERWVMLNRFGHKDEFLDQLLPPANYPKMKGTKLLSIGGRDFAHTEGKNNPQACPPEMLSIYSGG